VITRVGCRGRQADSWALKRKKLLADLSPNPKRPARLPERSRAPEAEREASDAAMQPAAAAAGPAAAAAADAAEAAALERVLHRVAATPDAGLEAVLEKLLPLAVGKLAGAGPAARARVMQILSHVNTRLRPLPKLRLPLPGLVALLRGPAAASSSAVRNFALVYVETAMPRAPPAERLAAAPALLAGVGGAPAAEAAPLLRLAAAALEGLAPAPGGGAPAVGAAVAGCLADGADRAAFLDFALALMLYQPPVAKRPASALAAAAPMEVDGAAAAPPPGLSARDAAAVEGRAPPDAAALRARKLGALELTVAAGAPPAECLSLYLAAAADPHEAVARRGEDLAKRRCGLGAAKPAVDLEDAAAIAPLFALVLGAAADTGAPPEARRPPAPPALRARALELLCKSAAAASALPDALLAADACLRGAGAPPRLRALGMQFLGWTLQNADAARLAPAAPAVLDACLSVLGSGDAAGGAAAAGEPDPALRGFAYACLGQLAARLPDAVAPVRLDLARRLLGALATEAPGARATAAEAAAALAGALAARLPAGGEAGEVLAMLEGALAAPEEAVRATAAGWLARVFPFDDAPARALCVAAAGDPRPAVAAAAARGLRPEAYPPGAARPTRAALLAELARRAPALGRPLEEGGRQLALAPGAFLAAVEFLEACPPAGGEGEAAAHVLLLENALAREAPAALHAAALRAMLAAAAAAPGPLAAPHRQRLLLGRLGHVDAGARDAAGRLLGRLAAGAEPAAAAALVEELLTAAGAAAARTDEVDGAVGALGFVAAALLAGAAPRAAALAELRRRLDDAAALPPARAGAALALAHAGLTAPLGDAPGAIAATAALLGEAGAPASRAARALGLLARAHRAPAALRPAAEALLSVAAARPPAPAGLLDDAADALALTLGGVAAPAAGFLGAPARPLAAWAPQPPGDADGETLPDAADADAEEGAEGEAAVQAFVVAQLLALAGAERAEARRAAAAWLAAALRLSGARAVPAALPAIQAALLRLLGDADEGTQDAAARGAALCYERAGAAARAALVDSLVGALTGRPPPRAAPLGAGDAPIFAPGELGAAPGGGALSTYKEVLAVATDLGQPDLVYKLMAIAGARGEAAGLAGAGAAFAGVVAAAGGALAPHVGRLVPRLYRATFDPEPRVAAAMARLWALLVDDPAAALEAHFDAVAAGVAADFGARAWRAREGAAAAAAELVRGRAWAQLAPHWGAFWTGALRAMDDVKESTRARGAALARTLKAHTLRLANPAVAPAAEGAAAAAAALPALLGAGLPSGVPEVRRLALSTLAALAKTPAARPHLAQLVPPLLEALSGLEDSALNYVEQHAAGLGVDAGALEAARVVAARGGELGEALDALARAADVEALKALAPSLAGLVRRGVGAATRAGAGRFVAAAARRLGAAAAPAAPPLMRALQEAAQLERSAPVARAYAGAWALLARDAAPARLDAALATWLAAASDEGTDAGARRAPAVMLRALALEAPDAFALRADELAPGAFLAARDVDAGAAAAWGEVWDECAAAGAGLRRHAGAVAAAAAAGLASSAWGRRRAAAAAAGAVAKGAGDALTPAEVLALLDALLAALPGRHYEGKEALLEAAAEVAAACGPALAAADAAAPRRAAAALLAGAARGRAAWRRSSLAALLRCLEAWPGAGLFDEAAPSLLELCAAPPPPPPPPGAAPAPADDAAAAPVSEAAACLAAAFALSCPDATAAARAGDVADALAAALAGAAGRPADQAAAVDAGIRFVERCAALAGSPAALGPDAPGAAALLAAAVELASASRAAPVRERGVALAAAVLAQLRPALAPADCARWAAAAAELAAREKLPAVKAAAAALAAALRGDAPSAS
jgi:proteasome component ECM29